MYILNFQTMIEIPESQTVARQVRETLAGRTVTGVFNATHPHKFIWYTGDPLEYPMLLTGRKIVGAEGCGAFVDVLLENDMHLALSDGVILRLYGCEDPIPAKYQLLVTLDDGSFLVCTVAMYGGINAFPGESDNPYYQGARTKCSPLEERFDAGYFSRLWAASKQNLSAKAFLATEQRIPGLGNGVLQDILFRAGIPQTQTRHAGGCRCGAAFQDAEKRAAGDDRPRRARYREGPLRETGRICRTTFAQHLRGAVPGLRRTDREGGLSGRCRLLLPLLSAVEIGD